MKPSNDPTSETTWTKRLRIVVTGIILGAVMLGVAGAFGVKVRPYLEGLVALGLIGELALCRRALKKLEAAQREQADRAP